MNELRHTGGTLLDRAMPKYEFCGRVTLVVDAPIAEVYRAIREVTLEEMPLARALGSLRYLPGKLVGRGSGESRPTESFIEQLLRQGDTLLAEEPNREIVIGGIGKFHQIVDQAWMPVHSPEEFRAFADPSYQKLAISIRIEQGDGPLRLVLEHRTHALGPAAERAFSRYWIAIEPMGNFVSSLLLRAIRRRAEKGAPNDAATARVAA